MDSTTHNPIAPAPAPVRVEATLDSATGRSRYWPEMLFFVILVFAVHLTMGVKGNIVAGNFLDTDVYSWLNRVTLLHEHGDWFDRTLPQVNPPHGHTQHWSRPFDAVLYAGAALGAPLVGFSAALEQWAVWVSPFLQALTLLALLFLLRPVYPKYDQALPVIAFLFVGHNALLQSFAVGRADHQSLLLLCSALALGCGVRMLRRDATPIWCYAAAMACALGIWVSVEFMLVVGIIQVAFGVYWLRESADNAQKMAHFSLGLLVFGSLAHFGHNGAAGWGNLATDEISSLYWMLFAGSTAFWSLAHWLTARQRLESCITKSVFALCGGGTLALVVYAIMPDVLTGPLGELDSLYERVRLSQIKEIQPIVTMADLARGDLDWLWRRAIPWLGLSIPALYALYWACRRYFFREPTELSRAGVFCAVGLLIFLPMTCWQIRWMGYAALIMVPAAAWTVLQILDRLSAKLTGKAAEFARIGVIMAFALGCNATLLLASDRPETALLRNTSGSTLADVAKHLGDAQHFGTDQLNILAFVDYGPEIIYRSRRHAVFAMPNHRPQPGFIASYAAMSAAEDAAAKTILQALDVDLILVRDHPAELAFYENADGAETFHTRLVGGQRPDWLYEIELPGGPGAGFRLYQLTN